MTPGNVTHFTLLKCYAQHFQIKKLTFEHRSFGKFKVTVSPTYAT